MKNKINVFIALAAMTSIILSGCGGSSGKDAGSSAADIVDVDLTLLSSTMVYSEVYNMTTTPDDYYGKKVKAKGQFSYYQDEATGNEYFAVLIADATSCCSQGIEFVLGSEAKYPDDYPEPGSEITVTGTFNTYEEDGYTYCQLTKAEML